LIWHCFKNIALIAAIMCGILATWAAADFGYQLLHPRGCSRPGPGHVLQTAHGISNFLSVNDRCPTRDDLAGRYVSAHLLVDPWGTSITFHCSSNGDVFVRSAGPDRLFHTDDDITNGAL
jgi:hypothetical protein